MKLSVLIPMYNAKDYIINCLKSLTNQDISEGDYEIIIMDDGSTDSSILIVENFIKDHTNIVLHRKQNTGVYDTRNQLFNLAQGKYVYFIDADDYIIHNCFSDLLNIAEENDADLIGFASYQTKKLDMFHYFEGEIDFHNYYIMSGLEFLAKYRKLRHEIWWYFVKKEFIEKYKIVFDTEEQNCDVVFTLRLLSKARVVTYLPYKLHRYVQTQNSLMRTNTFERIKKRAFYKHKMISEKSKLIKKLQDQKIDSVVINNLNYRRDAFVFFNLFSMLRHPFSSELIKSRINDLYLIGAYPITNFIGKEYHSPKYRFLNFLINQKYLVYSFLFIKNIFFRPKK